MIPMHIALQGFLSYRNRVEIDFTRFELACISGHNGAGKSSLLDAMTWALFGQARKRDDALVNAQSTTAEVSFTFAYEQNVYRVLRILPRGKTSLLEFHIQTPGEDKENGGRWKPLTERTVRDTQARIEETLRLDYDTFINASFFLQGKADQFTQQRPADRKRILGSILGLEVWEVYRQRAAEQRKAVEYEITGIDGRLGEINTELSEETERKARLKTLQEDLERLSQARHTQETALENIRKLAATLAEQRKFVETLQRQAYAAQQREKDVQQRLNDRRQEQQAYQATIQQAEAIQAAYQAWQQARADLELMEQVAVKFREQERRRQAPLDEINAARGRLQEEQRTLLAQQSAATTSKTEMIKLRDQIKAAQIELSFAEARMARRNSLDAQLQTARKEQAEAKAENPRLKAEMEALSERIHKLEDTEGADCPLCGQPLGAEQRLELVDSLKAQGKEMGDRYRANANLARDTDELVKDLENQISDLNRAEGERLAHAQAVSRLSTRLEQAELSTAEWETRGAVRLSQLRNELDTESFCPQARQRLAEIDEELKAIGYDVSAHDAARRLEQQGRQSEPAVRELERAQAALAPLEREISELEQQLTAQQVEAAQHQEEYRRAASTLEAAQEQAPDLWAAERDLQDAQQQENRLRLEVGAAQQKVSVLNGLKTRRKALESEREALGQKAGQYKQLERAFSKDGVPALLIEQALPQIESKANEILERLSAGSMGVRFITQAAYKDRRREDLRETLDIQISDGAGVRDYEMFSGGEAFRVNFAIRLALSEVLAQRAGARLQTLIIDEGFGSQDVQGRQRLIEAINQVRDDFAKILVITHIDELKDAFPTRIEVEKTDQGSNVRVI